MRKLWRDKRSKQSELKILEILAREGSEQKPLIVAGVTKMFYQIKPDLELEEKIKFHSITNRRIKRLEKKKFVATVKKEGGKGGGVRLCSLTFKGTMILLISKRDLELASKISENYPNILPSFKSNLEDFTFPIIPISFDRELIQRLMSPFKEKLRGKGPQLLLRLANITKKIINEGAINFDRIDNESLFFAVFYRGFMNKINKIIRKVGYTNNAKKDLIKASTMFVNELSIDLEKD